MDRTPKDAARTPAHPIILYDGVCGLCNRLNQFTLTRDKREEFRFAALQSSFAREILLRHRANPDDLSTLYVVTNPGSTEEKLHRRARAALLVLRRLGGFWAAVSILRVLPTFLLDLAYRAIASNRYRLFGRQEHCLLPPSQWRERFISTQPDDSPS